MIFLIEDSPSDAEAIKRGFRKSGFAEEVRHFETGDAALAHLDELLAMDIETMPPLPRLIVLDLNLPGLDGREVLRRLKNSAALKPIPVLVLSSVNSKIDIERIYAAGANAFMRKPVSFESLSELIDYTRRYWFDIAVMPKVLY